MRFSDQKDSQSIINEQLPSDLPGLTRIKIRTVRQGYYVDQ